MNALTLAVYYLYDRQRGILRDDRGRQSCAHTAHSYTDNVWFGCSLPKIFKQLKNLSNIDLIFSVCVSSEHIVDRLVCNLVVALSLSQYLP